MSRAKKTVIYILTAILCVIVCAFPKTVSDEAASADMGPKPSVIVTFENLPDEQCYGTLLSSTPSTGPHSVWNPEYEVADEIDTDSEYLFFGCSREIFFAFVDYEDSDGYYFLCEVWNVAEKGKIDWTYYPPTEFKILLYYPESDTFIVSDKYKRYAFSSYYTVDASSFTVEETPIIDAEKSYDYTIEILSLLGRILITLAIEILVALIFRLFNKRNLIIILITNIFTNVALNIVLNVFAYLYGGGFVILFVYIISELAVFIVEAIVYTILFRRNATKNISVIRCVGYAFVANLLSFVTGLLLIDAMIKGQSPFLSLPLKS